MVTADFAETRLREALALFLANGLIIIVQLHYLNSGVVLLISGALVAFTGLHVTSSMKDTGVYSHTLDHFIIVNYSCALGEVGFIASGVFLSSEISSWMFFCIFVAIGIGISLLYFKPTMHDLLLQQHYEELGRLLKQLQMVEFRKVSDRDLISYDMTAYRSNNLSISGRPISQYQALEKHLSTDYPEYMKVVTGVESEVRNFNMKTAQKCEQGQSVVEIEKEARNLSNDLNARLAEASQRIRDIVAAIESKTYRTKCDCCPKA
jgi:hypothetical protein